MSTHSLRNPLQKIREPNLALAQNHIIDPWALKNTFRITADMAPSHDHNLFLVPFLDDAGNLQCLLIIGREGGRNPKDMGLRIFNLLPNLIPSHSEMVVAQVEFEGAPVNEWIKILKVGKLRRDGDRPFLARLAIENSNLVAMRFQRSGEIGQTYRLRPYRCLVEISDGRLDEEDLHVLFHCVDSILIPPSLP